MIISIASDHAGFEQKQLLAAYLKEKGYEVHDLGPDSDDRVDYPDFAAKVAHEVAGGVATYGVLVCGTGIGMAVAANKINGIRAVNVINTQFAELCREHNDANIVTLSSTWRKTSASSTCSCPPISAAAVTRAASRRLWRSRRPRRSGRASQSSQISLDQRKLPLNKL